ncbi:MAG: hypothetical protein LBK61_06235 [Spirochaetaceae bacterium]|nr:hypothetical protein [Spirochaetaceae bacterium]
MKTNPEVGGGDGGGEDEKNAVYPFDAGAYTNVYVSGSGSDEAEGTEESPLATLEEAYAKALTGSFGRIVVLTNLSEDPDDGDSHKIPVTLNPFEEDATESAAAIVIEGRHYGLKIERSAERNDSVIAITNGAHIVFKNILINGKMPEPSLYHRALDIGGEYTKVTLDAGAKITGRKAGGEVTAPAVHGAGIRVYDKAQLVMDDGSSVEDCIEYNTGTSPCFGAVAVQTGAAFTMNEGSLISENTVDSGGGVYVFSATDDSAKSAFTMNGGKISGNTATAPGTTADPGGGGGVYLYSAPTGTKRSAFTMNGGEISGNSTVAQGGGVKLEQSDFTMNNGGVISGNTSGNAGGGVFAASTGTVVHANKANRGTFTMNGGEISGNTDSNHGGGGVGFTVGNFIMTGGEIHGNAATNSGNDRGRGGGVLMSVHSFFEMTGGEISLNKGKEGGGVFIYYQNTCYFDIRETAVIYGTDHLKSNTSSVDGSGSVYVGAYSLNTYDGLDSTSATVRGANNPNTSGEFPD